MAGHGVHVGLVDWCCPPTPPVPAASDHTPCHGTDAAVAHDRSTSDACCTVEVSEREHASSTERVAAPERPGLVWIIEVDAETEAGDSAVWPVDTSLESRPGKPPSLHLLHGAFLI